VLALSEGLTFAVIFQAARLLSSGGSPVALNLPGRLAPLASSLAVWPTGGQFGLLLGCAVGLQALMSLARYGSGVASGWFAARCQRRVAPAIHRHLLSLSYASASRYRVGDLVNRTTLAPLAVQVQLEEGALMLSNALLVLMYLAVLLLLTPALSLVGFAMALAIAMVQRQLRPKICRAALELAEVRRLMPRPSPRTSRSCGCCTAAPASVAPWSDWNGGQCSRKGRCGDSACWCRCSNR